MDFVEYFLCFLSVLNKLQCLAVKIVYGEMFFPLPFWQKMPYFCMSLECSFHQYYQIVILFLSSFLPTGEHEANLKQFIAS